MSETDTSHELEVEVRPIRLGWWLLALLLPPLGWVALAVYFLSGKAPRRPATTHRVTISAQRMARLVAVDRAAAIAYGAAGIAFTVGLIVRFGNGSAAPWILIAAIAAGLITAVSHRLAQLRIAAT